MGNLKINNYVVGQVQTNCYFAINGQTNEILIIDPGASAQALAQRIRQAEYKPVAILLTHGHFDHAGGAEELAHEFSVPIYAYEAEREVLENGDKNAGYMIGENASYYADIYVKDGQELDLAGMHIRVLYTPGHTIGGCCYYLPYEDVVFCGDTLFQMSVGRADLPTGSMSQLIHSIQDKLMTLPERTAVYPGHGEATTIEAERMYNPYL